MTETTPASTQTRGSEPVRAEAHGRVNLIGEHTDYNDGFVLPMAIPQITRVTLTLRDDDRVEVTSDLGPAAYTLGQEAKTGEWIDYVQGLTWALAEKGFALRGFDGTLGSDVPVGSGLSSSAALEVAFLRALREALSLPIDDLALAKIAHRAETGFVGVPVGLLDQLACSFADVDEALFIDTRTLALERIPLPEGLGIAVVDSGERHDNGSSEYRVRRAQCEEAARLLGVPALRDVGTGDLPRIAALPAPLDRRARHVVTENQRVLDTIAAMRRGDVDAVGALFDASHASMRDDYEVSTTGIDALVALARGIPGVLGARMTGGGFGGSIVVLTRADRAAEIGRQIAEQGATIEGLAPKLLVP